MSNFPSSWLQASLEDAMDAIIDYRGKSPPKSDSGIPLITAKIVKGGRILEPNEFIRPEIFNSWMRRGIPYSGDVVMTTEAPLGEIAQLDDRKVALAQRLITLRGKEGILQNDFLKYLMQSSFVQDQLQARATGTTVRGIRQSELRKVTLLLPPYDEQQAISAVLSAFDDKIELNRQMNATQEEMARAIFQSWFVDFDPVHAKARGEQPYGMDAETAAMFPERFEVVDGREIPAGWRVGTLGDIAQNPRRSIRAEEIPPDTPYIGLQHMPQQSIALNDWGKAEEINSNKYEFQQGEYLFGKLRPYFHKVGIAPIDGVSSTDILTIVPETTVLNGLVLAHISSTKFVDYTTAVSTGTRMPRTNWNNMSQFEIVIPTDQVASAFNDLVTPMLELITNNIFESRTLAETRDTLLPHLMSGQLRLS